MNAADSARGYEFKNLGTQPYKEVYAIQLARLHEIQQGNAKDTVFLVEHPHVYTYGKRSDLKHFRGGLDKSGLTCWGIPVEKVDRGGQITYHGPGQLVVYPIVKLVRKRKNISWLLRTFEEILINTLAVFEIEGFRIEKKTGVWTTKGKIASIGIGVKKWVSFHGMALNVNTDLSYFERIVPCGLVEDRMTSMKEHLGKEASMDAVKKAFCRSFTSVWLNNA